MVNAHSTRVISHARPQESQELALHQTAWFSKILPMCRSSAVLFQLLGIRREEETSTRRNWEIPHSFKYSSVRTIWVETEQGKCALRIDNICMKFIPPMLFLQLVWWRLNFISLLSAISGILPKAKILRVVIKNYNIGRCLSVLSLQVYWKNDCKLKWLCNEAWVSNKTKQEYSFSWNYQRE